MNPNRILIANRGEVAIRVMRAAAELGASTVAVYSPDDARCLHVRRADDRVALAGTGPAAYLDIDAIVDAALSSGCDALHPGYGFLAESAELARRTVAAGIVFIGPTPDVLDALGDKLRARALARQCDVPVARSAHGIEQIRDFARELAPDHALMIKAVAGGGGRGMRLVRPGDDLDEAIERAGSEASKAFGNGEIYAEQFIPSARHIEVQVLGDSAGRVCHLWERDCTVQRRHQKLLEIAPAPGLDPDVRRGLLDAAVRIAERVGYSCVGTFEFLVPRASGRKDLDDPPFVFIEANPRLQVEHTITEEITGIDIVAAQIRLAGGATLDELGLAGAPAPPRGMAMQLRINAETLDRSGTTRPGSGTIEAFEPAAGRGIRVDSYVYAGYTTNPAFDSLLAKLVVHSPVESFAAVVERGYRALCESRIEGVQTNIDVLANLLRHPQFLAGATHTRFVDEHIDALIGDGSSRPHLFFEQSRETTEATQPTGTRQAGANIDEVDPLAILDHGKSGAPSALSAAPAAQPATSALPDLPIGSVPIVAHMQGTVVDVAAVDGAIVHAHTTLLVMEAMKMEHVIAAPIDGRIERVSVATGDTVFEGQLLAVVQRLKEGETTTSAAQSDDAVALDYIRSDLEEVIERHATGLDARRPASVARRRKTGQRTTRENIADLCDDESFTEYGATVIAAQRKRRSVEDLIENTPADGMIAGVGTINADVHGEQAARCAVMSYDYTVLAGTQGLQNHRKKDRLFEIAEHARLPVVVFSEGGGGRPGDTDSWGGSGLDCMAFKLFAGLSGLVPLVGINSGRCFAGNAALLGCCDVVIATENSNIGMGGPAMVEGGGLGVFKPEDIGPIEVQRANGVVDIVVSDEAEAVSVAKKYLSYFQGPLTDWSVADQRNLRHVIPENRLRIYDVRRVIEAMADAESVLELRSGFGHGVVTALARIEGRPIGIVANNPEHLAGAIDSPGADKAARFMQLCDAFDIPVLFLCDTPGIMVGPESETTALVRHASRMFVVGASMTVPFFTIVLRKGYGLGAQAMAGGSFKAGSFLVAWPTGEFGGMGLEGAVKLGFRKELAAIEDPHERRATFDEMVAKMYEYGKAVNTASHFEIDDVIDPADSRRWILSALRSAPPTEPRSGKKRPCIDTW